MRENEYLYDFSQIITLLNRSPCVFQLFYSAWLLQCDATQRRPHFTWTVQTKSIPLGSLLLQVLLTWDLAHRLILNHIILAKFWIVSFLPLSSQDRESWPWTCTTSFGWYRENLPIPFGTLVVLSGRYHTRWEACLDPLRTRGWTRSKNGHVSLPDLAILTLLNVER